MGQDQRGNPSSKGSLTGYVFGCACHVHDLISGLRQLKSHIQKGSFQVCSVPHSNAASIYPCYFWSRMFQSRIIFYRYIWAPHFFSPAIFSPASLVPLLCISTLAFSSYLVAHFQSPSFSSRIFSVPTHIATTWSVFGNYNRKVIEDG